MQLTLKSRPICLHLFESGETLEIADLWYAVHCQSRLKSAPTVEVLEGPPEITVSVKKAMVVPREQNCSKPIEGAKLYVAASEIADYGASDSTIELPSTPRTASEELVKPTTLPFSQRIAASWSRRWSLGLLDLQPELAQCLSLACLLRRNRT